MNRLTSSSHRSPSFFSVRRFGRASVIAFVAASTACGGGNLMTREVGVGDVSDESTVKVEGDHENGHGCDGTLFADWSDGTSTAIAKAEKDGLVVVRLKGCKLDVLPNCHADSSYDFVAVTPTRDRTEVSADNAIAIGVMGKNDKRIGAEAGIGNAHSVEYAIVGQQVAKASPHNISGDCAGATHYVSAISVGAYELSTSEHSEVTAIVKLHEHKDTELHQAGDVARCSKQDGASDESCKTPIKLDLSRVPTASK